jgi:hypothetical protein
VHSIIIILVPLESNILTNRTKIIPKEKTQYSSRHRKKIIHKEKTKYSSRHRKKLYTKKNKNPNILLPHTLKQMIHKENTSVGMKELEVAKLLVWEHSGPCTSGYLRRDGF